MQCRQRTSYASNEGELFNVRDVSVLCAVELVYLGGTSEWYLYMNLAAWRHLSTHV